MRGSGTRKRGMTYSASCSEDETRTQDPKDSSSTMKLSHGETEGLSSTMKLSHNNDEDLSSKINTNVWYSSNPTEDSSSKLNNKVSTAGLHKLEQQASMKSSKPIAPFPNNYIEQICKKTESQDGSVKYCVSKKSTGYSYSSLLGVSNYLQTTFDSCGVLIIRN